MNPSTCPATSTASASLLHDDATALHALADELRSGATVLMPSAAPATPAEVLADLASGAPVATAPGPCSYCSLQGNGCPRVNCRYIAPDAPPPATPVAKVLRDVIGACRCEQYLRGEPAPTEPLALVRLAPTEADAVEYLHRAMCARNALEVRMEDGEDLATQVTAAYTRQNKIMQYVAQRWSVALIFEHDI